MSAGLDCVFVDVPDGYIYYSNGVQSGRITAAGVSRRWGVEAPGVGPAVSARGGILPAGRYQVAVTYVDDQGEESGASAVSSIVLASTGGVVVTLPTPVDPNVVAVAVYCTPTNGETFLHTHTVAVPTPATTTIGAAHTGHELMTLNMGLLPPGGLLAYYNGRLYAGSSNVLWYSGPYIIDSFQHCLRNEGSAARARGIRGTPGRALGRPGVLLGHGSVVGCGDRIRSRRGLRGELRGRIRPARLRTLGPGDPQGAYVAER